MIPILYETDETDFVSNGLGRLRDCISCIVTEERNGIFECDFEYPVSGANFDLIKCGRIIAVTHDDTGDLQPFDIVSYSKPIDGIVTFHCTHISYRLSGQTVWASSINSLASALTLFGNVTGTPFTYSADFSSNNYMAAADGVPRTVRQMLGGIEGSVLDSYGGEYEWNKWQVILHRNRGQARDFTIRYGVNLLDYQEDTDYQGTYASCIPYWVGSDDQGQQVVVRGSRVNSGLPTVSGRNDCVPLDLTDKFESKPTAAQLQTLAATIMTSQQVNLPAQTINVDFVRLQDMSEYAGYAPLLQCQLCDTIKVEFPAYGLSGRFKIVKTVWNALTERFDEMQLGSLSTTLAEALGISQGSTEKYNTITNLNMSGDLTVGGDASIVGGLTLAGHDSPIGTLAGDTASKTLTSVTASTSWQEVSNMSLTQGRWLIKGWASFNGSTAGVRYIYITTNSAPSSSTVAAIGNYSQYMAANVHGLVSGFYIADVGSTTTWRLFIRTTAGTPAVPYCQLEAIRIR